MNLILTGLPMADPVAPTGITGLGAYIGAFLTSLGTEFWAVAAIAVPIGLGIFGLFWLVGKGKRAVKG